MDFSLKQALEVLIAMLVVALVFMVTAYLLKNNGSKSTSTNSEAWKGVNAVEKKSKDIDTKDRFMAPVTYEDWVIDKDGNRRVKLGSKTINKRIGEYAHGSDIGGNTAQDAEIQWYYYIKDTSAKVAKSNNVVYRYFYPRFDVNEIIYLKDNTVKNNYWGHYDASKGIEYEGSTILVRLTAYVDGNEAVDTGGNKVVDINDASFPVPYGSTVTMKITYVNPAYYVKDTTQSYTMGKLQVGGDIQLYEK